jgi:hypothetical protein
VKDRSIDGPIDDPRRIESVQAQGHQHGLIRAVVIRDTIDHSLPRGCPPEAARRGQVDSRFVHEDQPVDVEVLDGRAEGGPQRLDALRVTLRRVERLFLLAA